MRIVLACLASTLLSSCALYPVVPYKDRASLVATGAVEDLKPLDLSTARSMIVGLRLILTKAASDRQVLRLIAGESLFYGTLIAAAGVAADSIATRNIGGGVAALSTVMSNHYKPSDQETVFQKAAVRAQCVEDALAPISPTVRLFLPARLHVVSTDPTKLGASEDVTGAYDDVPRVTLNAVNKIHGELKAALAGISLPASSKDDLTKIFSTWIDKKTVAENTKPQGDAEEKTLTDSVEKSARSRGATQKFNNLAEVETKIVEVCGVGGSPPEEGRRQQCEAMKFALLPQVQIEDAQRQFLIAIQTYKTTVDACLAQHTQ